MLRKEEKDRLRERLCGGCIRKCSEISMCERGWATMQTDMKISTVREKDWVTSQLFCSRPQSFGILG